MSDLVCVKIKKNGDTEVEVNSSTVVVPTVNQSLVEQVTFQELLSREWPSIEDTEPLHTKLNPFQQDNLIFQ